jgi:hypothetical protein
MKRIVLHIDRLVLRGFARADQDDIAEAMRVQLGELLANAAAVQNFADMPGLHRLQAGAVEVAHNARPAQIGKLIAGSIVRGTRR